MRALLRFGVHWWVLGSLARRAGRVVVVDDMREWKGVELIVAAMKIAAEIEGASESRVVGMLTPTSAISSAVALGAWIAGRAVVPLNYVLKREELQYVVDDSGVDLIIASRKLVEAIGFAPEVQGGRRGGGVGGGVVYLEDMDFSGAPEVRVPAIAGRDELAVLLYTSGTSGKPKGVMLTHGNIGANIGQVLDTGFVSRRDVFLGVLPQFHCFGFTVLTMAPLAIGAKVVFTARFVPGKLFRLIREHRATLFVAIPSMYNAMLGSKKATAEDLESLRFPISGGEPLPDAVAQGFCERFGKRICEGYGLTETSAATHICLPDAYAAHSVGKPLDGVRHRIVDVETEREIGVGGEGEIRLKGENVMRGYYKLAAESAAVFDDDGWFRTGDIGKEDAQGRLYITGRIKEMMIIGGENVFPREIEEVLNKHEAVHASAVVGVHDEVRGELPWAFVEMAAGAAFDETALRAWCREHLAGYKVPREIISVEELPKNPTGKILRRELSERVKAGVYADRMGGGVGGGRIKKPSGR